MVGGVGGVDDGGCDVVDKCYECVVLEEIVGVIFKWFVEGKVDL